MYTLHSIYYEFDFVCVAVLSIVAIGLMIYALTEPKEKASNADDTVEFHLDTSYNSDYDSYSGGTTTSKRDQCREEGCSRARGDNGTIYCDSHAAAYVREQGYNDCADSGCYSYRMKSSMYCSRHTCEWTDCTHKKSSNSDYCSTHERELENARKKRQQSTSSKKKATTEYEMPDCDDYDSYDDFMDDWDGEMPDGGDAEDYWEDW